MLFQSHLLVDTVKQRPLPGHPPSSTGRVLAIGLGRCSWVQLFVEHRIYVHAKGTWAKFSATFSLFISYNSEYLLKTMAQKHQGPPLFWGTQNYMNSTFSTFFVGKRLHDHTS